MRTWPPATNGAWYSSDSAQQTRSGSHAGHGDGHRAAGAQHAGQLGDGRGVVGDVLEHLGGDDAVEGAVGEGQPGGVALHRAGQRARSSTSPASAMAAKVLRTSFSSASA